MDQGQFIEVAGMSNAAHLRDVVLPACERRAAHARLLSASAEREPSRRRWGARLLRALVRLPQRTSGQPGATGKMPTAGAAP